MEPSELHNLEYEISGLPRPAKEEFSSLGTSPSEKEPSESFTIAYSVKVVAALAAKRATHNKAFPDSKTSLSELKQVYRQGTKANVTINHHDAGVWGMARVNLFLAFKSGESLAALLHSSPESGEEEQVNGLDFTQDWVPSDKCFSQAELDIEKFKLQSFCFASSEDLYLENYQPMEINI